MLFCCSPPACPACQAACVHAGPYNITKRGLHAHGACMPTVTAGAALAVTTPRADLAQPSPLHAPADSRPASASEHRRSLPPSDLVDLVVQHSEHALHDASSERPPRHSSGFVHYYEEGDPAKALHLLEDEMVRWPASCIGSTLLCTAVYRQASSTA